eukprot:scaffold51448_cov13-Tisochrysis_lutea.AAC.1
MGFGNTSDYRDPLGALERGTLLFKDALIGSVNHQQLGKGEGKLDPDWCPASQPSRPSISVMFVQAFETPYCEGTVVASVAQKNVLHHPETSTTFSTQATKWRRSRLKRCLLFSQMCSGCKGMQQERSNVLDTRDAAGARQCP